MGVLGCLFLFVHVICCIAIYILIEFRVLKVDRAMLPIVFLVPLWGELCVLAIHWMVKTGKAGRKTIGIEKLRVEGEIYTNIQMDHDSFESAIPLEEALLINESSIRRSLIMDVLTQNPEEYLNLLNQARMNGDVEVVHYATTAMSEVAKAYDLRLQSLEAEYAANPEDERVLERYMEFLEDYINKEMAKGQFLRMQQMQLSKLIKKRIETMDTLELCGMYAENELNMGHSAEVLQMVEHMEKRWPREENTWFLKLRYHVQHGEGLKVRDVIDEIERKQIYLSGEGKELIEFWKRK